MVTYCIFTLILVLVCGIYIKLKKIYTYWEKRGVKGPRPKFIIGNYKTIVEKKDSLTSLTTKFYNEYPNEPYIGIYHGLTPTLLIRDPELVKKIIVTDFSSFTNRGYKVTEEPLMKNLFTEEGDNWRILRQRLTPVFSSSKLKQMQPLLNNSVKKLIQHTNELLETNNPQEIRDLCSKYTLKCITSCAFGLEVDTYSDEGNVFKDIGHKIFGSTMKAALINLLDSIIPGLPVLLRCHTNKPEVTDFFFKLVRAITKEREGVPAVRKDFMDLLIEMRNSGSVTNAKGNHGDVTELEITDTIMAAQAAVFFGAGYETSSGSMTFLLYELALNLSIQDKCYVEIKRIMDKYNEELTFESLKEFEYVSKAFAEAIRKHAVGAYLMRQCVKDYNIPNSSLTIEKGIKIFVPLFGIQNDPKYFPDPEKFDPDRFDGNGKKLHDCTYLPFGDGPRNCIGMRFAKFQSMLGIVHFLYNFRVEPSERTPKRISYDPKALTIVSKDGVWLNIKRR